MHCAKCNAELELVFDGPMRRKDDWTVQYDRALAIEFSGGDGMFDDPEWGTRPRELTAVLCHDCAHQFLKDNPWVPVISNTHGHMHPNTNFGQDGHGHPI